MSARHSKQKTCGCFVAARAVRFACVQPPIFSLVGETLRRVRKERGKTLGQLAHEARVGKGQLSRIETGKQEVTLATLAKVLSAHGLSRREFFRRYDLVEAEAGAVSQERVRGAAAPEERPSLPIAWGDEVRAAVERIGATLSGGEPTAVAQGGLEIGSYVVLFRVVPRSSDDALGHRSVAVTES